MSSVGVPTSKRPGTAYAAKAAAKQRRQKFIAGGLGLALIAVLVFEGPPLLKLVTGSKTPSTVPEIPVVTPTPLGSGRANLLKSLKRRPASDPFSEPAGVNEDPTPREIGPPAGSVDPFAGKAPTGDAAQVSAPPAPVTTSPLPETIVIGTPGGNRKASHGWIVILASIPTGEGKSSATSFAAKARGRGLAPVSVLNSSNRRPLRGGYWVVYTGPYSTLSAVTARAGGVHSLGYPTAYIRQLIVYR
jgi:hypothetical protein